MFQLGDIVRYNGYKHTGWFSVGERFVVVAIDPADGHISVDQEPHMYWLPESFDLVERPSPETEIGEPA